MNENVIEWLDGQDTMAVTLHQKKFINQVRRLAQKRDDVKILAENEDGSIFAHIPLVFLKFRAPRELSEEQLASARENAKMRFGTQGK